MFRGPPLDFASVSRLSRANPPDRPYPRTVVYMSCDPATRMRDLRGFLAAGFTLTDVQPFDLFPRTRRPECSRSLVEKRIENI